MIVIIDGFNPEEGLKVAVAKKNGQIEIEIGREEGDERRWMVAAHWEKHGRYTGFQDIHKKLIFDQWSAPTLRIDDVTGITLKQV